MKKTKKQRFFDFTHGQELYNARKEDLLKDLEGYADYYTTKISNKDYNNIFLMYSFKEEYFVDEMIKRLSQDTILKAFNK